MADSISVVAIDALTMTEIDTPTLNGAKIYIISLFASLGVDGWWSFMSF